MTKLESIILNILCDGGRMSTGDVEHQLHQQVPGFVPERRYVLNALKSLVRQGLIAEQSHNQQNEWSATSTTRLQDQNGLQAEGH
jgi:hypothetical protein